MKKFSRLNKSNPSKYKENISLLREGKPGAQESIKI
jgi:hypothetical protein